MYVSLLLKKAPIVFILLFCFVISFDLAEAKTSIRLKKVKTYLAPRHISLSARTGNGIYAKRYAYGRPISSYSTKAKIGKNRRNYVGRAGNRKRSISRTYASRYRNWTPNGKPQRVRNNPRADKLKHKRRKELYPYLVEPPASLNNQKRRVRPHRLSAMQRPQPPKKQNEFDEDFYFPEEAKRAETKYEYDNRYSRPKKKRRPEFEQTFKKPVSKIPFYDDKPTGYKTKPREPPYSFTSFIQHPSGSSDNSEDFYEDQDLYYSQPVVRNKKKRVKKKNKKKNKEQFKPFVFESEQTGDSYPPYLSTDEYELPTKTYKKRNKPNYDPPDDDDEFVPSYTKPRPQVSSLFSTDSDYKGTQNTQQTSQFNPSYSQTWSSIETTARPVYQSENGFQPQYNPNQYNYNKDYTSLQKTKTGTNTQSTYYSQPDNSYKTTYNNYQSQTPVNYNTYSSNSYSQPTYSSNSYSQQTYSGNSYSQPAYSSGGYTQPTHSQPAASSSSILTDVTIQKSVPIYDNTETFYNYNNNANVNSQSSKYYSPVDGGSKYYDQDTSQKYGTRLSSSSTSYRNKVNDKTDSDSEFIKKHQNLYNNGLSGVPIQGDGYAKESAKKDYDIGYGDFQFDENPNS